MQTKLRIVSFLFAASLLPVFAGFAASQKPSSKPTLIRRPGGIASWYGKQHQGRKMANGQKFDRNKFTAASWTLPLGTRIRVMNMQNGKSVVVTVTDRGPNKRLHRVLDLSEAAARELDYISRGLAPVFYTPFSVVEQEHAQITALPVEPDATDMSACNCPPAVAALMR